MRNILDRILPTDEQIRWELDRQLYAGILDFPPKPGSRAYRKQTRGGA